jgi:glucose/mannose-6-phosphate isomerase
MFSPKELARLDPQNMREKIVTMYQQLETKFEIINPESRVDVETVRNIVITGLGGSAIGGELTRALLSKESRVPIIVNRNYTLPAFVDNSTLVIISSYSGNTEETISAYKEAIQKKAKVFCITSGGTVEKMAMKAKHYIVKIPTGFPPRTALGFSLAPMLQTLAHFGFIKSKSADLKQTAAALKSLSASYAESHAKKNLALTIAEQCKGNLPLIYTSDDFTSAVGTRWKGQICENAKVLAYASVLPELNHNELVGWNLNKSLLSRTTVIFLHDKADHPRTTFRMAVTKDIIKPYSSAVIDVHSEGTSPLARLFSLIALGDWVSYYLALLNKVDPTPVAAIDTLKLKLSAFTA